MNTREAISREVGILRELMEIERKAGHTQSTWQVLRDIASRLDAVEPVIDDGMLCHCSLSGEIHVVTSKTCCEVCTVVDLVPLSSENVAKALASVQKQPITMEQVVDWLNANTSSYTMQPRDRPHAQND